MNEDKNSKNLHIQNSSDVQKKNKKNKKKYLYTNSSYYYYKNKKKKKSANASQTTSIDLNDINRKIEREDNAKVTVKKISNTDLDTITKKELSNIKDKVKEQFDEPEDLIITKEFRFDFSNTNEFDDKDTLDNLKQAIDMYYYEEELGKFSIKEEKKYLKELPSLTEEEKKEKQKEVKVESKKKLSKSSLDDIDPIIEFETEPLPDEKTSKKKNKKKKNNKKYLDENFIDEDDEKEDLIITREIDFNYDIKDLKKKKVLNELKTAIDDFDRIETISEIEASVDAISDIKEDVSSGKTIEKVEDTNSDVFNRNSGEQVSKSEKKKKLKKKEKKIVEEKVIENNVDVEEIKNESVEKMEIVSLNNSDVDDKHQLDTQMQPLIEEDRFTQILNKIDLEEKLKELADSDESTNYLAQDFLKFKNKGIQKVQYDTLDKKTSLWILGTILGILLLGILLITYIKQKDNEEFISSSYSSSGSTVTDRDELYNSCMERNYQGSDKNNEVSLMEQEITEYVKNKYDASFIYQDVQTGYSFGYNSAEPFYAASTIKLLDALYVYTKAASGFIDLDATVTYTDRYSADSSLELKNHTYGEEITIRDLVKYAVSVSDNSAHLMLVSYIGKNKLKDFGNELGASYTMVGNDTFGEINGLDAIVYLKALNDFINTHPMYADELKELFINADQPYLNISDEIVAAHKYGNYNGNYHNIGIVYDENPYMVAILSHEGDKGHSESMIRDINERIYKLHRLYYDSRDTACYTEIYMD